MRLGDYAAARTHFEESLMRWIEGEDNWAVAYFTAVLGHIDRIEGDYVAAGMHYEASLLLWRERGVREGVGLALRDLGIALLRQGDYEQAARLLVESLPLVQELGDDLMLALNLAGLAAAAEAQAQKVRAARLMAASETFGTTTMYWGIVEVAARTEYEHLLAPGRAQKQDTAFAAAWAEGQAMGREELVQYALTDCWRGQDAARQYLPGS